MASMFKFLSSLFRKKLRSSPPDKISPPGQQETASPVVSFLAKDDPKNPFVVDGYDCLAFVQTMIATTGDQNVATSFVALRSSLGQDNVGKLPMEPLGLNCHLEYPFDGVVVDGVLFKARKMEEKWDIYLYQDRLYFNRSWTGNLAIVAQFSTTPDRFIINKLWVSSELASLGDKYPILQMDYLIKSHILKRRCPHPLPSNLEQDPSAVGLFSFAQFGQLCCFGTFENTLRNDMIKPREVGNSA